MTTEQPGASPTLSEGLGLPASAPKPRAWAIFVDSGNARMWSTLQPHVQKLADAEGLQVTPLYDHAALDAERKRVLEAVEQRLHSWQQRMMNKSGDRLALNDFMGQESIDDLIDYVCDEWA